MSGYVFLDVGPNHVYTCGTCGAVVHNMARHDQWHRAYETHGHAYAACYGPGGEWDRTDGPVTGKSEVGQVLTEPQEGQRDE